MTHDLWAGLRPFIRVLLALAIIAGLGWLVLQIVQLAVMLAFVLAR